MSTIRAFSYIRFSSREQSKGDSLRRQLDATRTYAHEHGWICDDSLNLRDLGVSGWRSANVEKKLGVFLGAIENGTVPSGSVLIVESLDRLSRDKLDPAYELFRRILRSGVDIVTLSSPPEHFTKDDLNNPFKMMLAIITIFRANNESEWKSTRVRAASAQLRKDAAENNKKITALCPGWLKLSADRTHFTLIPEAVETVRLIYKWSLDGQGAHTITKRLNREGIPSITKGQRRTKYWYDAAIQRLLTNRAVVGEFQPCKGKRTDNTPIADPIPNYFPPIISTRDFDRVRRRRERLMTACAQSQYPTLFPRLLRDARDKSVMQVPCNGPATLPSSNARPVSSDCATRRRQQMHPPCIQAI